MIVSGGDEVRVFAPPKREPQEPNPAGRRGSALRVAWNCVLRK